VEKNPESGTFEPDNWLGERLTLTAMVSMVALHNRYRRASNVLMISVSVLPHVYGNLTACLKRQSLKHGKRVKSRSWPKLDNVVKCHSNRCRTSHGKEWQARLSNENNLF
jgi:hypothetical protein